MMSSFGFWNTAAEMKSGSKEWGHAQNVWATGCQQLPLLPVEHLGSALHCEYPSRVFRGVQESLSPFFWNFLAKPNVFTWPHTGLCLHLLWCLQNMIWYQLHYRWLGKGSDSSSQSGVWEGTRGKLLFSSSEVPSWGVTQTDQLCHQTGIFLLEAYYSHCKLLQY